ncbi:MAG: SDR family oxidoreductase [Anaerolineales bacterium]
MNEAQKILVTGATGYIGGRLVPRLLEAGFSVRVLVRDPARLQGRDWLSQVEVCVGDVFDEPSLTQAMQAIDLAYYLIHSMQGGDDFHQRDLRAGRNFGASAHQAGVERIIYLGGLGDPQADLSNHLRSRQETGEALRAAGVPVTELRAAVVVGSGSISFEMIRYLAERVPIMVAPRWVYTRIQPIAIRNVLDYLVAAIRLQDQQNYILEIGGPDVLTYGEMLLQYADVRGLRRWILPVPVLTPRLSSYWVHWVTPIPAVIAQPLIEGLRNEVIVRDDRARTLFPEIERVPYREAVQAALSGLEAREVETAWSDALATSLGDQAPVRLTTEEGMIIERRVLETHASPEEIYRTFTGLGGETGWLYMDWAWRVRGMFDRLVGGVGFRRGRRDPEDLRVGDALDFWRVENLDKDRKMLLRAEMKLPGRAWLQFEVSPSGPHTSRLAQTAFFAPKGLGGLLYWYGLYPIHALIFSGLISKVAQRAAPPSK